MKVLFFGTPDFAAASLQALIADGFDVSGVVCQPDKPRGRGHKMMSPPVKVLAEKQGIPVYQPQSLKNEAFLPVLEEIKPDVAVVVAYGKILPKYILNYPKYGCVNVHGSLLPKYRGAAPIQWAVINGETETGVTTMKMDEGIDTGDMLLTEKTQIGPEETAEQLFGRLSEIGGAVLVKTLHGLEAGTVIPIAQNHAAHTYAPMIQKEMAKIDWSRTTEEIVNLVRGMNSWPMAYTFYEGAPVKVICAAPAEGSGTPGQILGLVKKQGLRVATGDGAVYLREVQFPGKKRMPVEDYMRGHEIKTGSILG